MREFKFRVWDLEKKFYLNQDDEFHFYEPDRGWQCPIPLCECLRDKKRYVVQQYTGMRDENNYLIFEGDIVKYITWHGRYDGVSETSQSVVRFQNGAFYPRFIEDINEEDPWYSFKVYDLEVVGNVFETPHLDKNN
jgi:uncharacterized phage protein (TIGR01671 family)